MQIVAFGLKKHIYYTNKTLEKTLFN